MNRFNKKKSVFMFLRKLKLSLLAFLILLLLFLYGINTVSTTTKDKQRESLETAINRNIIHCYAVEGTYPPSLAYMEEHYGLTYDKDLFFVDYQAIGANILPDVTIITKQ